VLKKLIYVENIMASVEIIGLLCAGSTRYHESGGCGCASERLTRAELAGLLSGLGNAAMNLAFAKYGLDDQAERLLIAHVRVWAAGVAVQQAWHIVRGRPTVVNLSALVVFETVRPNRCCKCSGRGVVTFRVCPGCSGSGFKALSGRKIADAIGVDQCSYRRLWGERYEHIYQYVQSLDAAVNRMLTVNSRESKLTWVNQHVARLLTQ
jgi:hypothetical protein